MADLNSVINGALKGREKDQRKLYEHLKGRIMGVCCRYTKDNDEAKDIFQEAIIKIFGSLKKLLEVENKWSWVSRVAINTAINHLKKNTLEIYIRDDDPEIQYFESQEVDVISKMNARDILNLLHELPDNHRIVFNLYMIDGYSHFEISEELKISESSSRVFLSRARRKMSELIQKKMNYEQAI